MKKFKKPLVALAAGMMLFSVSNVTVEANAATTCQNFSSGCRDVFKTATQDAVNSSGMNARRVRATVRRTGGTGVLTARIQRTQGGVTGSFINDQSQNLTTNTTISFNSTNFETDRQFRLRLTGDRTAAGNGRIERMR